MLTRIAVGLRPNLRDVVGQRVAGKIKNELDLPVDAVRLVKIFTIDGLSQNEIATLIQTGVLHDPVLQTASDAPLTPEPACADWIIEVSFRPGVTDNEGKTAREAIILALGLPELRQKELAVYTASQYHIDGLPDLKAAKRVAKDLLANDLLQISDIKSREQWSAEPGFSSRAARVTGRAKGTVEVPDLFNMLEDQMVELSRERTLALSLDEWWAIRGYFGRPGFKMRRRISGLIHNPTDVELECIAQTWRYSLPASRISSRSRATTTFQRVMAGMNSYSSRSARRIQSSFSSTSVISVNNEEISLEAALKASSFCGVTSWRNTPIMSVGSFSIRRPATSSHRRRWPDWPPRSRPRRRQRRKPRAFSSAWTRRAGRWPGCAKA